MKKVSYFLACSLAASSLMFSSCNDESGEQAVPVTETNDDQVIPHQYIVVFNEDYATPSRIGEPDFTSREEKVAYTTRAKASMASKLDAFLTDTRIDVEQVDAMYYAALSGFAATLTADQALALEKDPRVAYVEQDRVVKLDYNVDGIYEAAELTELDGMKTERQTVTCAVSSAGGPGNGVGKPGLVFILDTGIDLDHPDLNVNTTISRAFVDGNPDDGNGHGTHLAGIAAARNNAFGVVGVSAGAELVAVDVFGSTGATSLTIIISGMDYIASIDKKGDVVNMAFGAGSRRGCPTNSAIRAALDRLNDASAVSIAAGNSADDASFYEPGCHNLPRLYTIASMNCNGTFVPSSNFGSAIDYIAVGTSVLSTFPGGRYATLSGSSMASAVVAGIIHQRNGGAPRTCSRVSFNGRVYSVPCI